MAKHLGCLHVFGPVNSKSLWFLALFGNVQFLIFFDFQFPSFYYFLFSLFVHFRTTVGPSGAQKRRGEVKSVWTDPFRVARELLEPSWGRFGSKMGAKTASLEWENGV